MMALRLALRQLRREWRSGELAVLWLSLCVALAALTAVEFLSDRVSRALTLQQGEVLAADMRIESHQAITADAEAQAQHIGLASAHLINTFSAVFRGDANQLVSLRAVSAGYPLRGHLQVSDRPYGEASTLAEGVPARGDIWPDSRLASALGAGLGDTLTVGSMSLRVTRILISRPDQNAAISDLTSTALINAGDLPATRLIQPGSRVEYALLLAGSASQLRAFRRWWHAGHPLDESPPDANRGSRGAPGSGATLNVRPPGEHLVDIHESNPRVGDTSDRARQFLQFASLAALLLCSVAVAMSARSYVRRQLDVVALMKTLGASRQRVLSVSLWQMLLMAAAAAVVGSMLGWVMQRVLVSVLGGALRADLPAPGWSPVAMALAVAVAMLLGLALPAIARLSGVPALRVLRRDVEAPAATLSLTLLPAALALGAIIVGTLGDVRLGLFYLGGLLLSIAVLASLAWLVISLLARGRESMGGSGAWRYGVARLARSRMESVSQVVAFGLAFALLLSLAIIRNTVIGDWQRQLPHDVPNYFFINITGEQRVAFANEIQSLGGHVERMLPMVKARLTAIDGQPVETLHFPDERARRFIEREQNITWMDQLGDDNTLLAGRWWTAADSGAHWVSVAQEFRDSLHLSLGQKLSFDVAGEPVEVTIQSFRKVRWDSFRPNFFLVFPPGLLDESAGTWMTSARLPAAGGAAAQLARHYPEVTLFNVADMLSRLGSLLEQAIAAVRTVFLFTLAAGLTVLAAAVQSSRGERWHEAAILRALGAQRALIRRSALVEFSLLGLLAGILAATIAAIVGAVLASRLEIAHQFDPLFWLGGVLACVCVAALAGLWATRTVLNAPPRAALSQS